MKLDISRIIVIVVAAIVNVAIVLIYFTNLPLGVIPSRRAMVTALIPLDIIFIILIIFTGKEYEGKS